MEKQVFAMPEAAGEADGGNSNMQGTEASEAPQTYKPYTLRRLKSSDMFLMVRIISKIGINEWIPCMQSPIIIELIKTMFSNLEEGQENPEGEKETKQMDMGNKEFVAGMGVVMEIVNKIFQHLPECQEEIYQLLSNVTGYSSKEIKELDAEIFVELLVDFLKKEEFMGFARAALRLVGLGS